jgi:hypothetical protein
MVMALFTGLGSAITIHREVWMKVVKESMMKSMLGFMVFRLGGALFVVRAYFGDWTREGVDVQLQCAWGRVVAKGSPLKWLRDAHLPRDRQQTTPSATCKDCS